MNQRILRNHLSEWISDNFPKEYIYNSKMFNQVIFSCIKMLKAKHTNIFKYYDDLNAYYSNINYDTFSTDMWIARMDLL